MQIGLNLTAPVDYCELPFADLCKSGRYWYSTSLSGGSGPALDLRPDGWPAYIQPGCAADRVICSLAAPHGPKGVHTIRYEGNGMLGLYHSGSALLPTLTNVPGCITVDVQSPGIVYLRITHTDPSDPVRNVRVYRPGCDEQTWDPAFLSRWKGSRCNRYMDWLGTNSSLQSAWADRPLPTSFSWSSYGGGKGVPLELIFDHANQTGVTPWLCIPHGATDDYVTQFFMLLTECLSPNLTPYVEFSNEVWNDGTGFTGQYNWSKAFSAANGGLHLPEAYALRAMQCFQIGAQVFGKRPFVRVLSGQAGLPWVMQTAMAYQYKTASGTTERVQDYVDAVAIAPYVGAALTPASTLDSIFADMTTNTAAVMSKYVAPHAALANQYGKQLVAYECGQGLESNVPALLAMAVQANLDPRMGTWYTAYFAALKAAGFSLVNQFGSVGQWDQNGTFSLQRYADEPTAKYAAWQQACAGV